MRTRARVIGLLTLVATTLGSLVALGESHPLRGGVQEPSLWRAIAELQHEVATLRSKSGRDRRPPVAVEDLVAQRVAVGGNAFAIAPDIAPKLIVHDDSRETATIGLFKYSNGADLILENQSERSLAQDRIITGTGASLTLRPDQTATLFYDQTSARWRVLTTTGA